MSDFLAFVQCAGCGELFPVHSPYAYRAKWCSGRCRKAQYSTPCVDCGAPTNGSGGRGPNASRRCLVCSNARITQARRQAAVENRQRVESLWAEGLTGREICEAIGTNYYPSSVSTWRSRGYNLPHRRTPEQIARLTAGSSERMAKARAARGKTRVAA